MSSKEQNVTQRADGGDSRAADDRGPADGGVVDGRRAGLVVATLCLSVVVVIAGVAGITVAIPTIGQELAASQSELQWIIDSYAILLAALLLPAGALGDRFGRRRLMVVGWVVFVAASLWSATTSDTTTLILTRGVAGAGAALIFPGTLSTITNVIPASQRTRAVAAWTVSASIGGTIGSVGSGALIEQFWFGSIFLLFAVVGGICAVLTAMVVPETSDPDHANVDPVGSVLSIVGIGGLTLGIIEGPTKGWSSGLVVAGLVAGAIGLIGFVLWELRTRTPLLDVRLFRLRGFSTGSVSIFLQFFAAFGFFFTASQYLAFVFGYGPLGIGLGLLPIGLSIPLASAAAPALINRFGRGPTGAVGLAVLGAAAAMFAVIAGGDSYLVFAVAVLVFGAGFGLAAPPATEAIVEALPREKQGVASAINDVTRELGGALGIAIVGSAFTSGYRRAIDDSEALPAELAPVVRDSAGAGLAIAEQGGPEAPAIVAAVNDGATTGYTSAMWLAAAAAVVGAVYVAVRTPATGSEAVALDDVGSG
ncbi:MAG: MFS transporter [Actinomycetota bacterium]